MSFSTSLPPGLSPAILPTYSYYLTRRCLHSQISSKTSPCVALVFRSRRKQSYANPLAHRLTPTAFRSIRTDRPFFCWLGASKSRRAEIAAQAMTQSAPRRRDERAILGSAAPSRSTAKWSSLRPHSIRHPK